MLAQVTEVEHALLCPPSEKAEQQELALKVANIMLFLITTYQCGIFTFYLYTVHISSFLLFQIVCVILACLIILILTKLLYDYWHYRRRGKLPWIVYRMP